MAYIDGYVIIGIIVWLTGFIIWILYGFLFFLGKTGAFVNKGDEERGCEDGILLGCLLGTLLALIFVIYLWPVLFLLLRDVLIDIRESFRKQVPIHNT